VIDPGALVRSFATPLELELRVAGVPVRILTNAEDVRAALRQYYRSYVSSTAAVPAAVVRLVQGETIPPGEFVDIERGPGKKVKEAIQELPRGRLVLKRATGVVMGLWPGQAFAIGDLRSNLNQAINLVNACYAKVVLGRGYLLLHASGVSWNGRAAVLAGPPGAGKSTAALHFVEKGFRFLSNDRVLAKLLDGEVEVLGYPKQPRVNPGTVLTHPRLRTHLAPEDREALAALAPAELWALERKVDVDLEAIYGPRTVELEGRLGVLALLKWGLDGPPFRVRRLTSTEALTNVPFLYKDLGVFDLDRPPGARPTASRMTEYSAVLGRVVAVEAGGRVDFPALVDFIGGLLSA
jgi:HprK-related kinase B